jgi:hypothetical protein
MLRSSFSRSSGWSLNRCSFFWSRCIQNVFMVFCSSPVRLFPSGRPVPGGVFLSFDCRVSPAVGLVRVDDADGLQIGVKV